MPGDFTTYDVASGEILHTQFVGSLEEARLNEGDGHATIEGRYHFHAIKFVDGVPVEKTDEDRRPAVTCEAILAQIRTALSMSDRYFMADALENITQGEQDAWREYRKALRDAAKEEAVGEMIAAIPPANPKGIDAFQQFRR